MTKKTVFARHQPYSEYLKSRHWQDMRQRMLLIYPHCALCRSKGNLNVHHNSYENIGKENQEDLIVLCGRCHAKFHNKSHVTHREKANDPMAVNKPHNLVTAHFGGSAQAQDIVTTLCLLAKPYDTLPNFPSEHNIPRKALSLMWAKTMRQMPFKQRELTNKNGTSIRPNLIQEACEELLHNGILLSNGEHKSLFDAARFNKDGLTVVVSDAGKEILFDTKKGFAPLNLNIYFKLKSKYAKRLFELLTRYRNIDPKLTIKKIEDHLQVNHCDFAHFAHFAKTTLTNPIKEIVTVSQKESKDAAWLLSNPNFPDGVEVTRLMKNRTLSSDKITLHVNQNTEVW